MSDHGLSQLIDAEVERAEADFNSFRENSSKAVGYAGGVLTVLVGLLSIAAGDQKSILPESGRFPLGAAMLLLVVSALLGLTALLPKTVTAVEEAALPKLIDQNWNDDWNKSVALMKVEYLTSLRRANSRWSRLIRLIVGLQFVTILFLAVLAYRIFEFLS
jgi:hypothetical protein